jgi:hypothetical protein
MLPYVAINWLDLQIHFEPTIECQSSITLNVKLSNLSLTMDLWMSPPTCIRSRFQRELCPQTGRHGEWQSKLGVCVKYSAGRATGCRQAGEVQQNGSATGLNNHGFIKVLLVSME